MFEVGDLVKVIHPLMDINLCAGSHHTVHKINSSAEYVRIDNGYWVRASRFKLVKGITKPFVVILNAPPQAGKDTVAARLKTKYGYNHCEMKRKLFDLALTIHSISKEDWDAHYTSELKEKPWDALGGVSPRQALIDISEKVIKPFYGQDYFAKSAIKQLLPGVNVFSDGGFITETSLLSEAAGEGRCILIRIHREGKTFDGDSRSYLYPEDIKCVDVYNNSTPGALVSTIKDIIDKELACLKQETK